jgi:hypothetical protein
MRGKDVNHTPMGWVAHRNTRGYLEPLCMGLLHVWVLRLLGEHVNEMALARQRIADYVHFYS